MISTADQVRRLVTERHASGLGSVHFGSDLALTMVFDDERTWELIAERVSHTVSRPMVRSLSTFLG